MRDRQVVPQRLQSKVWSGLLQVDPAGVLEGGDSLVDNGAPGIAVFIKSRPLRGPSVAVTSGEFTVQGNLW